MRIMARGLTFEVRAGGPTDGEPVLLLHGFPQHSAEWDGVLPALHTAGLRSYAMDQRGYSPGARPMDVAAYRMSECVADVFAVLDALRVDAVHLVGHDWGAVVAWHFAARYPDRVRTLTAVSVPHPAAMAHAMATDPDQREKSAYIRYFRRPGKAERGLLADGGAGLRRIFAGVGEERIGVYVEPMGDPAALTAALNWFRAMSGPDLAGLPPVAVPTTFVWSDGDTTIGRTAAEACAGQVTGDYRFVVLVGVTHWIPDEVPAILADVVLTRITDTVGSGADAAR